MQFNFELVFTANQLISSSYKLLLHLNCFDNTVHKRDCEMYRYNQSLFKLTISWHKHDLPFIHYSNPKVKMWY